MTNRFFYFDLGNVLVTFDHRIAVDQLASLSGKPSARVQSAVFESGLQDRYETGRVTSEEYAAQINSCLSTQLPHDEILEAISAIFTPNDSILPVLKKLRGASVRIGILSNTCEAHWRWIAAKNWSVLCDWFDVHVLSYEVHSMKPDSQIYEVSEQRSLCDPNSIFFTDDRQENIESANSRGWSTHLFRSSDDLLQAVENWLG